MFGEGMHAHEKRGTSRPLWFLDLTPNPQTLHCREEMRLSPLRVAGAAQAVPARKLLVQRYVDLPPVRFSLSHARLLVSCAPPSHMPASFSHAFLNLSRVPPVYMHMYLSHLFLLPSCACFSISHSPLLFHASLPFTHATMQLRTQRQVTIPQCVPPPSLFPLCCLGGLETRDSPTRSSLIGACSLPQPFPRAPRLSHTSPC